mgnify:CR=1 FL=1
MSQSESMFALGSLLNRTATELDPEEYPLNVSLRDLLAVLNGLIAHLDDLREDVSELPEGRGRQLSALRCVLGITVQYLSQFPSHLPLVETTLLETNRVRELARNLIDTNANTFGWIEQALSQAMDGARHRIHRNTDETNELIERALRPDR